VGRGVTVVENQRGPARELVQNLLHPIGKEEKRQ
jgi:hypothetical protein